MCNCYVVCLTRTYKVKARIVQERKLTGISTTELHIGDYNTYISRTMGQGYGSVSSSWNDKRSWYRYLACNLCSARWIIGSVKLHVLHGATAPFSIGSCGQMNTTTGNNGLCTVTFRDKIGPRCPDSCSGIK